MKKRTLIIAGVLVLLTIIVIASIRSSGPEGEKVYVEPAATRRIESVVTAPGQIDPKVKVNISAHIVGKIEKLYFDEGDEVKRGQKLVELEKPAYLAQRDRLRAEVANQQIEVARAKNALANAELTYRRAVNLRQQGIQAQELFDRAQLELENARAGYASAKEGVVQSEAMLRQADTDLSRTTIVSPIDGKVVELNAHEGEVVITGTMNNPGSVIAVVADLSLILVEAEVGETEVTGIRMEQSVRIKVDAVPDKEFHGHVVEIGASAAVRQNAGSGIRYFKVKVAIDDPDEQLRPGMTSQVSIVTSSVGDAVAVPIQAVVERVPGAKNEDEEDNDALKKKFVLLAKDDKAHLVEVKTGISDATHVAILSGVKKGDNVIVGPFRTVKKLKDGAEIYIEKESKTQKSGDKKEKDEDE